MATMPMKKSSRMNPGFMAVAPYLPSDFDLYSNTAVSIRRPLASKRRVHTTRPT